MVELLRLSRLSDEENRVLTRLGANAVKRRRIDARLDRYYEGQQRLDQLGLAVPPELRRFETLVNWPRIGVDEVERRLDVKTQIMPGEETASKVLREGWDANNLDTEAPLLHKETMIVGRGFVTVGANPDDADHPIITVEPSKQMVAVVEARRRRMLGLLRSYKEWDGSKRRTLYMPNSTIWLEGTSSGWAITDRDDHGLGRIPAVMFLNRRRPGDWWGVSEMADIIPLTDAAARSLTNLQLAQETHSVPTRYIFGVDPKKMVDPKTGDPLPVWEAYYTALMAHANKDIKAGQFDAADLKNFTETVNHYGQLTASVTGLPARYFVNSTVNPAAEGAIRADESRLVKNTERKQTDWGDGWGWVMGLYERFRTGEWLKAERIRTEWHDAGTPTFAQKSDAIQKLSGGVQILSREGAWDEMGWSEPRKEKERQYLQRERNEILGLEEAPKNPATPPEGDPPNDVPPGED